MPGQTAAAALPFLYGTQEYTEQVTLPAATFTLGAAAQNVLINLQPNGFLRGVTIQVSSPLADGALGGGALSADAPWTIFDNIQLDSVDGTNILGPMPGYQAFLTSLLTRTWDGDPRLLTGYSATVNPNFDLRFLNESRTTLGVLPNTDGRATYKLRFTLAALGTFVVGGAPTSPTLTIQIALETYSQPALTTLDGRPVAQVPDGMVLQRFISRETQPTSAGFSTIQAHRTGNMIRNQWLTFRSAAGVLTALTGDPIRIRVDTTSFGVETRAHNNYNLDRRLRGEYGQTGAVIPVGTYHFCYNHNPGTLQGVSWLDTSQASYIEYQVNGAPAGGTVEIMTEDLALVQVNGQQTVVPGYLEGI